jgi:hypothetical protein
MSMLSSVLEVDTKHPAIRLLLDRTELPLNV